MITTGVSNDQKAIKNFVVMQAFSIFQHQKIPFGGSKCSQFVRSKKNPYFLYMYIKLHAMRSGHNVLTIFGIYSSLQQAIQVWTSEYLAKLENILVEMARSEPVLSTNVVKPF